jgi:hypothetical protein
MTKGQQVMQRFVQERYPDGFPDAVDEDAFVELVPTFQTGLER